MFLVPQVKKVYMLGLFWLRTKKMFTIPPQGQRVYYPGCALVAGDSKLAMEIYEFLNKHDPDIKLWFDSCGAPIFLETDLRRKLIHKRSLSFIKKYNIKEMITTCGYCNFLFNALKEEENLDLKVIPCLDLLAQHKWDIPEKDTTFTIHEPCAADINPNFKDSFYKLLSTINIKTKPLEGETRLMKCCISQTSFAPRIVRQLKGKKIITFCFFCAMKFSSKYDIRHIYQILFKKENKIKVHRTIVNLYKFWKFSSSFKKKL